MSIEKLAIILLVVFTLQACRKKEQPSSTEQQLNDEESAFTYETPDYFPVLKFPASNPPSKKKFLLGKKLFYDPILSINHTVSCGSCHQPAFAYADSTALSEGVMGRKGQRNSPSLTNIAYVNNLFWDGGVPGLELQVLAPLDNHLEVDLPFDSLLSRLNTHEEYYRLFTEAFGTTPNLNNFSQAIACFERAFISGESKFDEYYYKKNSSAFNESEKNGMKLFFGQETGCSNCHDGFNFTNGSFQNNGIYKVFADQGRYNVTGFINDLGKFKVPVLRNVERTAPYMHDGSFKTLEEVIEHYNTGGKGHSNQSGFVKPLNLNQQQKADLVNFLKTLTDQKFLSNKNLMPE